MNDKKRVVVTGLGAVTPIGLDVPAYWEGLKSGTLGIGEITSFSLEDFPVKIAAEITDYDPKKTLDKKAFKRMDRMSQLAMTAAKEAFADADLPGAYAPERAGVILGNGIGGILSLTDSHVNLLNKGPSRVSPFFVPMAIGNMAGGNIAIELDLKGPNMTVVTACAASTNAIGEAMRKIQGGEADIMLTGGTEASICPLALAGFHSMSALSDSADPQRASIPFDRERSGFVMGEGAAVLVLEELEHARKRGATIYAELSGYGATCDAYHITAPESEGTGAVRAMELALEEAGIARDRVGYINAHGTSTPYNDEIETRAIRKVFGDWADQLSVSSTKSMTGHLLGAAGAIEAVACVKALVEGVVPPTIGMKEADPACDLDYTTDGARTRELEFAMSNSLGFGGHNAVILLGRWNG